MAWQNWSDGQILYAGSLNNNFDLATINIATSDLYPLAGGSTLGKFGAGARANISSGLWTAPVDCIPLSISATFKATSTNNNTDVSVGTSDCPVNINTYGYPVDIDSGTTYEGGSSSMSFIGYTYDATNATGVVNLNNSLSGTNLNYLAAGQVMTIFLSAGQSSAGSAWASGVKFSIVYMPCNVTTIGSTNWS